MTISCSGVTTLLCDADGNLFPSEEPAFAASAEVTNDFLSAVGVRKRFTAEQLRVATTGKNFRTTAADLAVAHGVPVDAAVAGPRAGAVLVADPVLTIEELERWIEEERRRVSGHLAHVLRPEPEVREPLFRLADRFELAAVSSSATARLAACFAAAELTEIIPPDRWYSAEDSLPVPTSKPDPAIYAHACRELGVDPTAALAVEDSVPGVQSAVAAGIRTVGNLQFVPPAERRERELALDAAGAAAIVSSWSELDRLLSVPC